MHRILLVAALVAAAVAVPSAAHAATVERYDGIRGTLLVTGAPDESNLITVDGSRRVVIADANMPLQLKRSRGCKRLDSRSVRCSSVRQVWLDLNDGADVATVATSRAVWVSGGAGDDRYNSRATDAPSQVEFDGGFGDDVANYFYATEGVTIGVDGAPFDGRPGDNDRIDRDVETVLGSNHADVLVGTQREQRLFGLEGDDEISGGPASDLLVGGRGDDRIDARDGELDAIDCGGWLLDRAIVDAAETSILGCAEVLMPEGVSR
jgi:Ca2+-binding RTX toxin-like protein